MAQPIRVAAIGLEQVKRRFKEMPRGLEDVVADEIAHAVRVFEKEVLRNLSGRVLKVRSGRTRTTIRAV